MDWFISTFTESLILLFLLIELVCSICQNPRLITQRSPMAHWLDRLLSPRSIAIVGASARKGSLATSTYELLNSTRFTGEVFLVNPKYEKLFGQPCYSCLKDLPRTPDLVVFVISGLALEVSFWQALELGVGGIVMYASNHIEEDSEVSLPERLKQKARAAGVPVLGGNCMGFYNYDDNIFISFDAPPEKRPGGHIGLIAHSGSAMTYLANNDARFCYNYVISSGQETNATVADYMDYLLEQASTKAIVLFLESVRDVDGFVQALKKAQQKNIAIVITKLGRTEKSAELAISHSGAIAGNHDAFAALCKRYGVILANDIDELITTAMLIATCKRVETAGISSMLDSGGMRELMIDLAEDYGLTFADVSEATKSTMHDYLEHGLVAENPLDAMGALGRNTEQTYLECGKALLDDSKTGLLTHEFEFRDGFTHYPQMFDVIDGLSEHSQKPLIIINSFSFASLTETAVNLTQRGIPMINGIDLALRSIKNFIDFSLLSGKPDINIESVIGEQKVKHWNQRLPESTALEESQALELLHDFDLSVIQFKKAHSLQGVLNSAGEFGYPVVVKTAETGIQHKTEAKGVKLALKDADQLAEAYTDLNNRLGPDVLVMPMAKQGVEIALGMKNDPQYGPLLIVSAGGILIELIKDRALALAPVNARQAASMLEELKVTRLLQGVRGQPAMDVPALIDLMVKFSNMIEGLSDSIAEIDMNPVIVHQQGCTIVDALIVTK